MTSRLSIITINLDNLNGLKKTIESVASQTFQDFEYIIIDGASTDGSIEFIQKNKERVNYFLSEPDKGVYDAMNKGIASANGDYLLFLNSGDHFIDRDRLALAYKHLDGTSIIYFDLQVIEGENRFSKSYPDALSFSFFVMDTLPHPATFIKRSVLMKLGLYDTSLDICADWKFFIDSICKQNSTYKHVNQLVSTFYIGGMSSDPRNYSRKMKERETVLNMEYAAFVKDIEDIVILKKLLANLKESRFIQLLIRLHLINKF